MENKNYFALMILCGSLVCFGCSQDTVQFEWRHLESGTAEHLYGVHFIDTKHGWAVGTGGAVSLYPGWWKHVESSIGIKRHTDRG